jgi:transcriptional regulator with XRE-family HTH domain
LSEKPGFDAQGFWKALDAVRETHRMSWRQVAQVTQVSASTLTRMAQGSHPDATGLARLCRWAALDAADFLAGDGEVGSEERDLLAQMTALLRADRRLASRDADALDDMLKAAYRHFRQD